MDEQSVPGEERLRWGPLFWVVFVGVVLLAAAVGVAQNVSPTWTDPTIGWRDLIVGILINLGTAFLPAGVLFLFNRNFIGQVIRTNQQALDKATAQVEQRIADLATRLGQVQPEVEQLVAEQDAAQDRAADAFEHEVSYTSITNLLTEANRMKAIYLGRVITPASSEPDGPRLAFSWRFHPRRPPDTQGPFLGIEVVLSNDEAPWHQGNGMLTTRWAPGESAADVGARLIGQLRAAGLWRPGILDFGLALRNLHRLVGMALRSRRGDEGAWPLQGSVIELVDDAFVITDAGVEVPSRRYVLPAERGLRHGSAPHPPAPVWADQDQWQRVLARRPPQPTAAFLAGVGSMGKAEDEAPPWTGFSPSEDALS